MEVCDYCGQYEKVRKVYTSNGNKINTILGIFLRFNFVCKKCSDAMRIIADMEQENMLMEAKLKHLQWIEERDKLLEEHGKDK